MLDHVGALLTVLCVLAGLTLVAVVVSMLWVFHNSKKWHGVGAAALVERLSVEVSSVRGNFEAFKRDTSQWKIEMMDCNHQILRSIEAIQHNGAKESPLEERIQELKEDVLDIEQTLHALPCFIDRDVHRKLMDEILKKKETDNA